MNYLAGVARIDPPKPKVCITKKGKIIIIDPEFILEISRVPCVGPPPPAYCVIITLTITAAIDPNFPTAFLTWNIGGMPATLGTPGSVATPKTFTIPTVVMVTIKKYNGVELITLYANA